MTVKGKRLFNNRPVCFAALVLSLGIIVGEAMADVNPLLRLIPICILIVVVILMAVFSKSRRFVYLPIFCLIGLIAICGSNDVFASHRIDEYNGVIQARVASEIVVEDGKTTFYVDKIIADGKSLRGQSRVYLYDDGVPQYSAGDIISIKGKIGSQQHNKFDSYYAYYRANNLNYFVVASDVDLLAEGSPSFPLNIQLKIKKAYYQNMDSYSASICQALMLGDKTGIDDGLYNDVAASGLAHVLAVSGLHITALSTALYFLLRKIKVNTKVSFVIVTVLTFLYAMLCSFTPSVLRAFIMSFILMFAAAFGKKQDSLSSLSLAAVIILLIRPTALMEVGFLLSIFAVLGIFLFYKPINAFLMRAVNKVSPKRHFGKSISQTCAVSLSANIATAPFAAFFFGKIPTLFLISNIIILPYMMFCYLFLLAITLFAMITPLTGIVGFMQYLLLPFKLFVGAVGGLSVSQIPVGISVFGILAFILSILTASRFVFIPKHKKIVLILTLCTIVAVAGVILAAVI